MKTINELLTENFKLLSGYALKLTGNKYTADDLVQDTAVRIIEKQNLWNPETKFSTWAIEVMKNVWLNTIRYERIRETDDIDDNQDNDSLGLITTADDTKDKLLNLLPNKQKDCMELIIQGYDYSEIAEKLNIPIGTVKSRIYQARNKLKNLYGR